MDENIHLFINPVFGLSNQPNKNYINSLLQPTKQEEPKRKWAPFYAVQFRLNEEKYGIAFTGEVRGLLRRNNQPFVSLALSKKFDLAKFMEFNN